MNTPAASSNTSSKIKSPDRRPIYKRVLAAAVLPVTLAGLMVVATGCAHDGEEPNSFLDPTQIGGFKKGAHSSKILNSLDVGAAESNTQYSSARPVQPSDLESTETDYQISPNDTLSIQVSDLVAVGTESTLSRRVTQSGKISLPLLEQPVTLTGMTEQQAERTLIDAFKDSGALTNPRLSVAVVEPRGRTYSVTGAVGAANQYVIYDNDFRLLDALVAARDVSSSVGIDTIYVIRKTKNADTSENGGSNNGGDKKEPASATPAAPKDGSDPLAPQSSISPAKQKSLLLQADGQAPEGGKIVVEGREITINKPPTATGDAAEEGPEEGMTGGLQTGVEGNLSGEFAFESPTEPDDREVIKVPYNLLRAGELKYNIVIKPGDLIFVPPPIVGEYYMGGNVLAPGAYSLSARNITLSQAIVAARGFNEVAWPSRTEVVRRLPGDKQVFVRVDLDKIFTGLEPDLYLKPDDRVNVGTHVVAPFLAAFRNGFRFTYGLGFLYDKNFASNSVRNR